MTNAKAGPRPLDIILVGGGLSAGLIALALARHRPELSVALVEAGASFGGNHTWSSFATDVSLQGEELVTPLIAHRWDHYDVRFPNVRRTLDAGYRSATSDRLDAALNLAIPPERRFLGVAAAQLDPTGVTLADGRRLEAEAVIDARGQRETPELDLGFQKFVGLELELTRPHGLTGPIIMDATIDQHDGYRFVYVLPFTPTTMLVEDTYYANGPDLNRDAVKARVMDYVAAQGWEVAGVLREELGVLPIAIGGDIKRHLAGFAPGIAPVGLAAGLFHPVTGYSFPDAVATALKLADHGDLSGPSIDRMLRQHAISTWESRGFYRVLNKMLFRAALPDERRGILEHFYRLDAELVRRFYAGQSSLADKMRILWGKPPIPVGRAVRAIMKG